MADPEIDEFVSQYSGPEIDEALGKGLLLPTITAGDAGKAIFLNATEDGFILGDMASITQQARYELMPAGMPFPVWDNIPGVSAPDNTDKGFIKLTAGLTDAGEYNEGLLTNESVTGSAPLVEATAEIASGPLAGQTVHLINTEESVLRARTTAGVLQHDQMQRIWGDMDTWGVGPIPIKNPFGSNGALTAASAGDGTIYLSKVSGDTPRTTTVLDSANSPNARTSLTHDGETRPKNVSATFYMRIV
jgi:hypothetical protein